MSSPVPMHLALLGGSLTRSEARLLFRDYRIDWRSSRVLVSKSRTLTYLAFTIPPRSIDGIRTGSLIRIRSLRNTVNAGTEYGSFSLPIVLLPAGTSSYQVFNESAYAVYSQGSASVFQITMHKNLNAYHRIKGVVNHASIHVKLDKEPLYVYSVTMAK